MVKMRVCAVVLVLALLLLCVWGIGLQMATAQSPDEQLLGRFEVMWGDPETGEPVARYGLFDSEGRRTELVVDDATMSAAGGLLSLNRQPVVLMGNWQSPLANGNQVQGGESSFQVNSIRRQSPDVLVPLEAASGTPMAAPVSGSQRWVTVLCRFSDSTGITPHPREWFDPLMLGGSYPGLDHYWQELSFNQINLSGSLVVGWYNLPQPRSYYVYDRNGDGRPDLDWDRVARDCASAADADVYFRDFLGVNLVFNQDLDGYAWGGGVYLTNDGIDKVYYATWLPPWGYEHQAVIGHEMGHGFGLPHSSGPYTATYDSGWDVMSSTWRNCVLPGHPVYGCIGQHTISFHKDLLGWVSARRYVASPGSSNTIEMERLSQPFGTGYLMAKIPIGGSATQFYTVEARQRVGYDEILLMPPSSAVVMHHVDTTRLDRTAQVVDSDGNGDPNDDGAMLLPGETFTDLENQISVAVNAATATGFQVTITNNSSAPPTVGVTPSSHDFGSVIVGSSSDFIFSVQNIGGGILTGTASVSPPFSIVSGGSYNLGAGESQDVMVRFTPSSDVAFYGSVSFTGGGGATREVTGVGSVPILPRTLVVSRVGTGTGKVSGPGVDCGFDCQESYPAGTIVGLSAVADPGSVFSGWSGDADCADGTLTMSADRSCAAVFNKINLPDLIGSISATQTCRRGGCRISGSVMVLNQGNATAPASLLRVILSDDAVMDPGDTVLQESSIRSLLPGRSRTSRVRVRLPLGVNASGKYLFAVIDPLNTVVEGEEANNTSVIGPIP